MSNKSNEQQLVRQRDRFVCQVCGKPGEQYAHIVPDSEGGAYNLENLVLLCYDHHNYWLESARAGGSVKANTQATMRALKEKLKQDGAYSRIFSWTAGDHCIVDLGGGFKFIDHERILESATHPHRPYLCLRINDLGLLVVNASFEDDSGKEFMRITDNLLELNTIAAWDIKVSRRHFSLIHTEKRITLEINQSENLELVITGRLYLNGGYFEVTDKYIHDIQFNNWLSNNQSFNGGHGLVLKPGTIII